MRIDGIAALQQAATNYRMHGAARVVACFHGVVALGMSGGAAFVLLPRGLSAEGGPEASFMHEWLAPPLLDCMHRKFSLLLLTHLCCRGCHAGLLMEAVERC